MKTKKIEGLIMYISLSMSPYTMIINCPCLRLVQPHHMRRQLITKKFIVLSLICKKWSFN